MIAASTETIALAAEFTELLRSRAVVYFTDLAADGVQVRLTKVDPRPAGTHFHFEVGDAVRLRRVLIKVRPSSTTTAAQAASGPPLIAPPSYAASVSTLEFRALSAIHERFSQLDQLRFGTVRPLDSLPNHDAVVMEFVSQPSLRALFFRSSYLRSDRQGARMEEAFHNTGAWLRHFHTGPRTFDARVRRPRRADLLEFMEQLAEHLADHRQADRDFWRSAVSAGRRMAHEALPEQLPLGGGHGDFAMRNLLIGPGGRVTAVDTHGAWYTPIYEDIGTFLHSLRFNRLQVLTRGAAIPPRRLASYEHAFLSGYFEDERVPQQAVRLYEALASLEKWSSLVAYRTRAPGRGTQLIRTAKLRVLSAFLRETVQEKLCLTGGQAFPRPALHAP